MIDATVMITAGIAFVGAQVAQKCTNAVIDEAWERIKSRFKLGKGGEPVPADLTGAGDRPPETENLLPEAELVFGHTPALRRAALAAKALDGALVLWIDDHPENNEWERVALGAFGVRFVNALDTSDAVADLGAARFDVIISDIARGKNKNEGVEALPRLREVAPSLQVILYTGFVDKTMPRPFGTFGHTDRPDELIHLVLDVLERTRV